MSADCCESVSKSTTSLGSANEVGAARGPRDASQRWTFAASASSVVSAILASACCVGPLILALLGFGGGALMRKFEPYRPYLWW